MPEDRAISSSAATSSTIRDAMICLRVPDMKGGWVREDWAKDPERKEKCREGDRGEPVERDRSVSPGTHMTSSLETLTCAVSEE